jgi:predicted SAM-dependent methyltransferase
MRSPQAKNRIKKVQVGCGPHNLLDDWWNVDIKGFPGIDEVMDATQPWPYEGLQYVFDEHFLEHLTLDGAIKFLTHAGISLRVGGKIRLSTPNLDWVLRTHYSLEVAEHAKRLYDTLKINRAFHGWGHRFLYSRDILAYILTEMNFEEISFFSYGESHDPALKNLERHGGFQVRDGAPSVIVVEAERGQKLISPSSDLTSLLQEEFLRYVAAGH